MSEQPKAPQPGRWPNPWHERAVYVTQEQLAECVMPDPTNAPLTGEPVPRTVAEVLAHWAQYGDKLDAYILIPPRPGFYISAGVRYGADGADYLSMYVTHPDKARALIEEAKR